MRWPRTALPRSGSCSREHGHEIYSVSGGQPRTLRTIVERYLAHAGSSVSIRWGVRPYHEREVMRAWQGGAVLPGWAPRVDIEAGLRELAAGFGAVREAAADLVPG